MIISHRRRFVFYSFPKSGSTSVRHALRGCQDEPVVEFKDISPARPFYSHMRPCEAIGALRSLGYDPDEYRHFGCVRNPWARLYSFYSHESRLVRPRVKRLVGRYPRGFDQWLTRSRPDGGGAGGHGRNRFHVYGSYSVPSFYGVQNDLCIVSLIRIGLPRLNVGEGGDYRAAYSSMSRDLVHERYGVEIERFGYEF